MTPIRHANEDTSHTPLGDPQHTHTPTPTTTTTQPPVTTASQNIRAGYTRLPLPTLQPTEIRIFSHNINSLPTTSIEELGASFDMYRNLNPTILGLQETNKNWSKFDPTVGRVKQCVER